METEQVARIHCAAMDPGGSFPCFIPLGYLRSSLPFSSLCTNSTRSVSLNRPSQNRTSPTVSMLSATGRPRGFAGCGGFPWGSRRGRGRPIMSSRCKKIFQILQKAHENRWLSLLKIETMRLRCFDRLCYFRTKNDFTAKSYTGVIHRLRHSCCFRSSLR